MPRAKRAIPEINASSMADIAFLLLVFFLVTTTMDIDRGILVTLPPYTNEPPPDDVQANARNVLEILVNSKDQLLVENELTQISELKEITMKHVDNRGRLPEFSDSPNDAIVSLKNDKSTTYKRYIEVYNEIRAGYNELRNQYAMQTYGVDFKKLTDENMKAVRAEYPLKLSEADQTDFGAK